jgi:ABC-type antimicrobial peptide transport system permease subunit
MENFGFESTIPMLTDYDIPLSHGIIIFIISLIIVLYPTIVILRLNPLKAMKN